MTLNCAESQRQLSAKQFSILRVRHHPIIGQHGIPLKDHFDETSYTDGPLLSEEDYDLLTVTRPLSQVQAGSKRPMTLPRVSDTGIQLSNTDELRFYNKSRGGAATDAADITK